MQQFNQIVPVAQATTDTVVDIDVASATTIGMEVKNSGAAALDVFEIWGMFSEAGSEQKLLSLSTDYTTPVYPCLRASASPTVLSAGSSVWVILDVKGLNRMLVKASGVAATTLEVHGSSKVI